MKTALIIGVLGFICILFSRKSMLDAIADVFNIDRESTTYETMVDFAPLVTDTGAVLLFGSIWFIVWCILC